VIAAAKGLPASVQARLVRHAKATGIDPNAVLARFAAERFLYRLSRSRHADRFVLKGALLMLVWLGNSIRPTRDADLLGFGDLSRESLARILVDVCNTEVEPDGVKYLTHPSALHQFERRMPTEGYARQYRPALVTPASMCKLMSGLGTPSFPSPNGWSTLGCSTFRRLDYEHIVRRPQLPRSCTPWLCWARSTAACGTSSTSMRLRSTIALTESCSRARCEQPLSAGGPRFLGAFHLR